MITPLIPRHIVSASWLPVGLVSIDSDLQTRYLGDDPNEVCEVAAGTGDPRLIASCLLSLDIRLEALTAWRVKQVETLLKNVASFREFYNQADPLMRETILSGECSLVEIDVAISTARQEVLDRKNLARQASKNALRAAIQSVLRDSSQSKEITEYPGFLAILENGEVGIFIRRTACIQWARASGGRFLMGVLEREAMVLHPGSSGD